MTRTGKAAILQGPSGPFTVEEMPVPEPGPGDVLIKIEACGICGTDIHVYKGHMEGVPYPAVIGHEPVGIVESIGERVRGDFTDRPLRVGDRVFVLGLKTCGRCYFCSVVFEPTRCMNAISYGFKPIPDEPPHFQGGFAQYIDFREGFTGLFKMEGVSAKEAVLVEPLSCSIHAVDRAEFRAPSTVVIQGTGAMGLGTLIAAKEAGASKTIVIGAPKARLRMARELGADVTIDIDEVPDPQERIKWVRDETMLGLGADIVFEVTGVPQALPEGIAMLRDSGQYITLGHFTDNGAVELNPFEHFTANQIDLKGVWGAHHGHLVRSREIVESGKYPLEQMVTHEVSLEDLEPTMEQLAAGLTVDGKEVGKATVVPWLEGEA